MTARLGHADVALTKIIGIGHLPPNTRMIAVDQSNIVFFEQGFGLCRLEGLRVVPDGEIDTPDRQPFLNLRDIELNSFDGGPRRRLLRQRHNYSANTTARPDPICGAWVIEALGAAPIAMPAPELPPALQKGVVDGALIPCEIIPPLKIQAQTQFQIEGFEMERFGNTTFQVSMNAGCWAGLPEDIQQAFRDTSGRDWRAEVGAIWRASDDFGLKVATEAGNTHTVLTEAETAVFRDTIAPVVEQWITEVSGQGIDGAGLVERARILVAQNAAAG